MYEAIYIPAISEKSNYNWLKHSTYKDKEMKWFGKNGFFNYPFALQSSYYAMPHGLDYREKVGFPKNALLMGDSGGFQIASFRQKGNKIDIDPIKILRWMEANCDIGFNIDVPPAINTLTQVKNDNDFFNSCLKKTQENMKIFEQKRENYDMKLYNVMHGYNYKDIKTWYAGVKDFKFDGWGLGGAYATNSRDIIYAVIAILYLHSKGELEKKGLHFFGASGKKIMSVVSYLAKKLNMRITYDSSSFKVGSTNRFYNLGNNINLSFSSDPEKYTKVKSLPCDCPICKIVDIDFLHGNDDVIIAELLDLHNLYRLIQDSKKYNKLVDDKETFLKFVRYNIRSNAKYKEVIRAFSFIDYYLENGLDTAIRRYGLDKTVKEQQSRTQRSLFKNM